MNIPTIGGARGIFEIFIPGTFLLLNLASVVYLLPFIDEDTKNLFLDVTSNPGLSLIIIICFGYLIGIILRLFSTKSTDKLSVIFNKIFVPHAKENGELKPWFKEDFPYSSWIGEICKSYLPHEAHDFYNNTWGKHEKVGRQTMNFYKTVISSTNEKAAFEIYSAESLTRYISGIFYSLVIAFCLLFITLILKLYISREIIIILPLILLLYLFGIAIILKYYRFIRIKEVETVFAAAFVERSIFEENQKINKYNYSKRSKRMIKKNTSQILRASTRWLRIFRSNLR